MKKERNEKIGCKMELRYPIGEIVLLTLFIGIKPSIDTDVKNMGYKRMKLNIFGIVEIWYDMKFSFVLDIIYYFLKHVR